MTNFLNLKRSSLEAEIDKILTVEVNNLLFEEQIADDSWE